VRKTGIVELIVGGCALWVFQLLFDPIVDVLNAYSLSTPMNLNGVILLLLIGLYGLVAIKNILGGAEIIIDNVFVCYLNWKEKKNV